MTTSDWVGCHPEYFRSIYCLFGFLYYKTQNNTEIGFAIVFLMHSLFCFYESWMFQHVWAYMLMLRNPHAYFLDKNGYLGRTLSNFYLNLSKYLNKDFRAFDSLLAENFFKIDDFLEAKKIYENLNFWRIFINPPRSTQKHFKTKKTAS